MNYDRLATAVAAAHETYVADLRSLMMGLRLAGKLTPTANVQVRRDLRRALSEYLRVASALAGDHLTEVYAGSPLVPTMHKRMVLLRPLHTIARAEQQQLMVKIRGAGMGGLINEARGPFAQLAKRFDERFDPTAQDSAGRTWQAGMLVRFLARDFAYQSHIDSLAARIQESGATVAQVVYLDPRHENHGLVIELPIDDEIRAEIFHPNANAQLQEYAHVPA